jgi:hypothetical protein
MDREMVNKMNEDFYDGLTEDQKSRVEDKLDKLINRGEADKLEATVIHEMRCQIASDMYKLLKG